MLIKLLALVGLSMVSFQPQETAPGLTISITNLRNQKGHVLVSVFRDGKGYPDKPKEAFKTMQLDIVKGVAVGWVANLPAGNYAVAILHDENNDQKMNTNWFGIPKEGYGFSNNVMGMFGPPNYDKARFEYKGGTELTVNIRTRY